MKAQSNGKSGEVWVYGEIGDDGWLGGIGAKEFADQVNGLDVEELAVHINSPGGDWADGVAMHTTLVRHPAKVTVTVDGLAASAASFVAMAGDEIEIAKGAFMMIHNPWTIAMGDARELRAAAENLDKITDSVVRMYVDRTGQDKQNVVDLLNEETWLNAEDAVELGFATSIMDQEAVTVACDESYFAAIPEEAKIAAHAVPPQVAWRREIAKRVLTLRRQSR